ncbi:major capsid protein [Dipodfec virus RodF1_43]|uniref:Major capsid protein n=1 Tax=Dipodfec virus RodF1_43 TaxID=2929297 RepID=A0A976N2R1_9VIRU|nr:major capsid protein [Dipodfec virus RodF1_43]
MASKYTQISNTGAETHFSAALFGNTETSRMVSTPQHLTTFNAGDIVPIGCYEILPDDVFSCDVNFVIRPTTMLTPTMGQMTVDLYAFFVPHRVVNQSLKAVMGENYNGSWTADSVVLAPLVAQDGATDSYQIPVGSVADYYGFPTQQPIPYQVLADCHDLKFRGYVMIYNEYFRDQNYQPPIPMSTLNVYQGFFDDPNDYAINIDARRASNQEYGYRSLITSTSGNGQYPDGAVVEAIYGAGAQPSYGGSDTYFKSVQTPNIRLSGRFHALDKPLKANKLHDYFTSVLPAPQKGVSPFIPVTGTISNKIPVYASTPLFELPADATNLRFDRPQGSSQNEILVIDTADEMKGGTLSSGGSLNPLVRNAYPNNLYTAAGATVNGLEISINDLRMASAIQQVYEGLARGGSRYREFVKSFFGIEVDDPFSDIPQYLGHIRRGLDVFQTAQTSSSVDGGTPQGNLAAFGYTSNGGNLFSNQRFAEHGYLHIFAVVRHKNVYSSFMARDNFRRSLLDFYIPPLANISNQPVYLREINPFGKNAGNNAAIGYQEAWAEYRYDPDTVSGYMRPGVSQSLSLWNYADDFNSSFQVVDGAWLKSNSEEVLNRSLSTTSNIAPQFKGQFMFIMDKTRPMPTYSVPGMDII